MKNIFSKNQKTGLGITILSVAIIAIALSMQPYFSEKSTSAVQSVNIPRPPPLPMSFFGDKTSSFNEAKINVGVTNLNLPSYVPGNLVLESIRNNGDKMKQITVVYAPQGKSTTDNSAIQQATNDGLVVTINKEQNSKFDWNTYVTQQVQEAPDVRSSVTVHGAQILLVKSNPEYGTPYQAKTIIGDQLISAYSTNLNAIELSKVIESMVG